MKMFVGFILVFCGLVSTGCATISWNKMDLDMDRPPTSQIHNLKDETVGMDTELKNQVEDVMRRYLDSRGEEYGFYTVNFGYRVENTMGGLVLAYFSGFFLFVPNLLGMPITTYDYRLGAYLNVYDSKGDVVQTFEAHKNYTLAQGIYYGNPTKKAGKEYSKMLEDLLRQAERETETINGMLEAVGPITIENTAAARSKIRDREK